MRLSGRILNNLVDVNNWNYGNQEAFTAGDVLNINIQLIDLNKDTTFNPTGKRYVSAASPPVLTITINNLNQANTITKVCTQPFASDGSIWRFSIASTDPLPAGTYSIQLALTEGANVTRGVMNNVLNVLPVSNGFC